MKIGRKLMISNILISLVAMVFLSVIITNIVSDYIEADIRADLVKENKSLQKTLYYKKFVKVSDGRVKVDLGYYEKLSDLPVTSAVFLLGEEDEMLGFVPSKIKNPLNDEDVAFIFEQKLMTEYDITVSGKAFLAYNSVIEVELEGEYYPFLVTTMLPNVLIREIINQITKVLLASIVIISVLSVVVTSYNERKITRPIATLKEITEKIAEKNFEEKAVVKTGDELESLAIAINNMAESLKKQDEEQKKFYENISHELKTPLTVISGYAQGIKTNIFDDDDHALDTIVEVCGQLKRQLENVIYLSKLDNINEFYHYKKISANRLISGALKNLDSIIILNEIDIIYEPVGEMLITVDEEKFVRMLVNVLSNCIKYTKGVIEIKAEIVKGLFRIEICDNGPGFNGKVLEKPFSRTLVGDKEGSGLGLSIIKKIIDGHKGTVALANRSGGACYTLEIPVENEQNS